MSQIGQIIPTCAPQYAGNKRGQISVDNGVLNGTPRIEKGGQMIEQRAVLKKLTDNPVTETAPWIVGEPSMHEVLGDPVVHAVLRRDGLGLQDLTIGRAAWRERVCQYV